MTKDFAAREYVGRRPTDGSFPSCPATGICRAESVRNHSACRNCAQSDVSLCDYLSKRGTNAAILETIPERCLDLLTRIVDSFCGDQASPDFEKVALMIYMAYGLGNVANRYLGCHSADTSNNSNSGNNSSNSSNYPSNSKNKQKPTIQSPVFSDPTHARMILSCLGLTCYKFDNNSSTCRYIEDIIYCKRHTPILSVHMLKNLFQQYEKDRSRKRKASTAMSIIDIKNAILKHETKLQKERKKQRRDEPARPTQGSHADGDSPRGSPSDAVTKHNQATSSDKKRTKDLVLRKKFNEWLHTLTR